jgi:hypothetical protein
MASPLRTLTGTAPVESPFSSIMRWASRLSRSERILIGIFLLTVPTTNPYIRGDGNEYYAYVRSIVIDHDLRFENEYRRGDPAFLRAAFDENGVLRQSQGPGDGYLGLMPNGYVHNPASVGPSLLWSPFFIAAHGSVLLLNQLGANIPADGYSLPYRWVCALATVIYAFLGLALTFKITSRFVDERIALLATLGIWFASSLPVYMYFLPFHAPALSSFGVALFLWVWLRNRENDSLRGWALWGATAGLMVQLYYLNGVLLAIPLLEWCRRWIGKQPVSILRLIRPALLGITFAVSLILSMLPNFIIKGIIYGSAVRTGYSTGWFTWSAPHLAQVGFSSEHGMFLWTPVLLFSLIGLCLLWRRNRWVATELAAAFALFYYAVSSFVNWHGNSSFGSRFFVSLTPVFVLGLAVLVRECGARLTRPVTSGFAALLLLLSIWNFGFIFQWGTNIVPNRGPVDISEVARNQVTIVPQRIFGFVFDYLRSRDKVTKAVERDDLKELP